MFNLENGQFIAINTAATAKCGVGSPVVLLPDQALRPNAPRYYIVASNGKESFVSDTYDAGDEELLQQRCCFLETSLPFDPSLPQPTAYYATPELLAITGVAVESLPGRTGPSANGISIGIAEYKVVVTQFENFSQALYDKAVEAAKAFFVAVQTAQAPLEAEQQNALVLAKDSLVAARTSDSHKRAFLLIGALYLHNGELNKVERLFKYFVKIDLPKAWCDVEAFTKACQSLSTEIVNNEESAVQVVISPDTLAL